MYRQLYQMGGIGSLPMDYGQSLQVPQQMQPSFSSAQNITMNPLLNYGQTPLTMASGGIANLVDREKYGLGSKIKKFVRNIIPNEVAKIAEVAAPFVAPFNPLLAAGMAGIGNFDRTGSIGGGLKSAALTYGGGQLGRYVGGAGFQEGINPFAGYNPAGSYGGVGSLFSSPIGTETGLQLGQYELFGAAPKTPPGIDSLDQVGVNVRGTGGFGADLKTIFSPDSNVGLETRAKAVVDLTGDAIKAMYTNKDGSLDKRMIIATISGASTYLEAKKKADEAGLTPSEFNEQVYNQEKSRFSNTYQTNLNPSSFGIRPTAADGGMMSDDGLLSIKLTPREGYLFGNVVRANGVAESFNGPIPSDLVFNMNEGGGGIGTLIKRIISTNPNMFQQTQQQPRAVSTNPVNDLYKYYLENGTDEDYKRRIMESVRPRFGIAMGGEIPTRQNPSGVTELDMRAKGGYIPVGIKEKADDVPAMLSKNEFVFTADAVRGAGDGSINKGAQKMYKLMKSLEKKINKTKVI